MKEQKNNNPNGPIELDLFTAAELAAHAMEAEAEETRAAQTAENQGASQAAGEIEFTVNDTTAVSTESAGAAAEGTANAANESAETKTATSTATDAPKKKKKKKKKGPKADSNKPKTFFDQIHDFINEDEDQPININVRGLLGGDGLPNFFKRNWLFISLIVIFTCCYVTCRYMMQSAVLEHDKLTEQLIDRRYKNLTLDCELLERTLSSHVEKNLKDSTIHTPTEQAFHLPVEAEEE